MSSFDDRVSDSSRRIGWLSISAITIVVLLGFLVVHWFTVSSISFHHIQTYSNDSKQVWRQIFQHVSYVLGRPEGNPLSDSVSRYAQEEVRRLLLEQQQIEREIRLIASNIRFRRYFVSDPEWETVVSASIDADVDQKINDFIDATPAILRAGFSSWNATTHMKLRTGIGFNVLNEREAVLNAINTRIVGAVSSILLAIGLAVLAGIWLIWFRALLPNIASLRAALVRVVEQNEMLEEARLRLTESQREFQLLFDNLPGSIATISSDYTYLSANKAYLERLGFKLEGDIVGQKVEDIVEPAVWSQIEASFKRVFAGERVTNELPLAYPEGQRYVRSTYVPEMTAGGKVERMFALIVDIHDRVIAEQALKANEKSLGATLDALSEAVIATDTQGNITRLNKLALRYTGLPLDQVLNRPVSSVFEVLDSQSGERIPDIVQYIVAREGVISVGPEARVISPDGKACEVILSGTRLTDDEQGVAGFVLVFRDVTEETELRAVLSRDECLRNLGQLAGGVAHNFNNLLAGISGAVETLKLKSHPGWSEESDKIAENILNTCTRAADLSQKLMAFSTQNGMEVKSVDLHMLIEEAVFIFEQTADKNMTVLLNLEASNPYILGSASEVESIFMNLFVNAAQAMNNSGCIAVNTSERLLSQTDAYNAGFSLEPGRFVEIEVADTGEGISDDLKDEVFRPFFSTKEGSGNVGLGLSTVYGAVVDMKGAIFVDSVVGTGTTFRILLPRVSTVEPEQSTDVRRELIDCSLRVLLVDDEKLILESTKLLLQSGGHHVVTAGDGQQAVDLISAQPEAFDLVITDLSMPRMNGITAARRMLAIRHDLPIVLMSGYAAGAIGEGVEDMDNLTIIKKPFKFSELDSLIRKLFA